tara:strand:+ start:139 stop:1011 length:873 start_codon:yes stop_codon:yes gene_type:complete
MRGVIAAVPTPIDNNGEPIIKSFLSHCSWVLKNGCDGINILGSTGEASSFNSDQRKKIMENTLTKIDKNRLMVGTGTPSLSESIKLTQIASDLGYKVALVLPPFYYKPLADEGLFHWYKALHEKLGGRKIKIYFYNFPQMTGIVIPIKVINELNRQWPNRFAGIKDSSGDLNYCRTLSKNTHFKVFPSSEVSISEAYSSNFAGCISATVNQTLFLAAQAWANKDQNIDDLILQMTKLREEISKDSLIPSIKYLVSERTKDKTWENLLPPLNTLSYRRKLELSSLYKDFLS